MGVKSDFILKALSLEHNPKEWAFFEELRIGTGFTKDSEQRLDAWAICYHPSKRNCIRGFEVKVSRGDFLSEVKKPLKRRAGMRFSNEFYFVTQPGLLKIEDIPYECGLLEVDEIGHVETIVPAVFRDTWPASFLFMASICRRADKARRDEWDRLDKERAYAWQYANSAKEVLDKHYRKWREYSIGNKEIPDKIADAIDMLRAEIHEITKDRLAK